MKRLQEMRLEDILAYHLQGQDVNCYPFALNKSRYEKGSLQLFSILHNLYEREGDKWIEVVVRLIRNNYPQSFSILINGFHFYRALIEELYNFGDVVHVERLTKQIVEEVSKVKHKNTTQLRVIAQTLGLHFRMTLLFRQKIKQVDVENILFAVLGCAQEIRYMIGNGLNNESALKYNRKSQQRLYNKCCLQLMKEMAQLISFSECLFMKQLKLNKLFTNITPLSSLLSHYSLTFVNHLPSLNIGQRNCQQEYCLILQLIKYVHISHIGKMNTQILAERMVNKEIINDNLSLQQLIILNNEVYYNKYSQTSLSVHCEVINALSQNMVGFLRHYLSLLTQIPINQHNINDILLKLMIVHQQLKSRNDLSPCIKDHGERMLAQWQIAGHKTKLQILKYISIYGEYLSNQRIHECFQICINILISSSSLPEQILKQCQQIVIDLPSNDKISRILAINSGTIATSLLNLPFHITSFQIIQQYISIYSQIKQRNGIQLVQYCSKAFQSQLQRVWKNQQKSSQLIVLCLNIVQSVLQAQIQVLSIENSILNMLKHLQQPYKIEFQDQLLSILIKYLQLSACINHEIQSLFPSLTLLYRKNNKKLSALSSFFGLISHNKLIIKEIMYEDQVLGILLSIIIDYFSQYSQEEFALYKTQTTSIFELIITFIEAYQPVLTEKYANNLELILRKIHQINQNPKLQSFEHLLQIQLSISHIIPHPQLLSLVYTQIHHLSYFKYQHTITMIPIIILDSLIFNPESHAKCFQLIQEFGSEYRSLYNEKMRRKLMKNREGQHWNSRRLHPKDYGEQKVRNIKKRLDSLEYAKYMGVVDSNLSQL